MSGRGDFRRCRSERPFRWVPDPVKVAGQVMLRPLGIEGADESGSERVVLSDRHYRFGRQLAFEVFTGVLEVAFAAAVELPEQPD
jgi:hypothetical protein